MEKAEFYCFHDLTLEVRKQRADLSHSLSRLLHSLSFIKTTSLASGPSLRLCISTNDNRVELPPNGRVCFDVEGFRGVEALNDDFYLTDGCSVFHLHQGVGRAHLSPSFFSKSALLQENFWCFGLLKLLRWMGIYSLHAAGATADEHGVLIVGASGSGKSTLAVGLLRAGWGYLSDDAVLIRLKYNTVEALALRKNFYIDGIRSSNYSDLPLGEEVPDSQGRQRRRVCVEQAFPEQSIRWCIPRVLLFPRIVPYDESRLIPLDRARALRILLAESGPQLFDTSTMARHLDLLKTLLQQSAIFELRAGSDLHHDATKLVYLLKQARGDRNWRCLL
jgi:hypothetical protein